MPIVLSKDEYARITKWTEPSREDSETARRREYVRYLDETSKAMTKEWPNSLENVNKRNEELRRARLEAAEQANTKFYRRYLKRQREEQQRLMHSARDIVFKNKDAPKLLLSAVIETVIQKERNEQVKFRQERRRELAEQKKQDDDDIIRKAKEWQELMALKRKRRFDANKRHQKEILDQAHEVAERNRMEYEKELHLQKIDNIKADEQMAAIKEFEKNFKAAEKARIWSDMDQSRKETEVRRREQAARDRLDDRLLDVLSKSRARVEQKRRQTEKEIKDEKLRVLEKISQRLESGDAARDAKERDILEKAIREKEAIDEERRAARARRQEQFRAERVAERERCLRADSQRARDMHTMRQWDIMNRFKNAELYEEFQEKLRIEKERKVKEYREELLKLWKEREDREARERAETRYFYGELAERKLRDADNKLLTHAAVLLDEARAHNRPDHALRRAVDRYCKMYRLYPMPDLPLAMQEHFKRYAPWDGSKPDPGYKEPPPPPPDLGPDAPDEEEPGEDEKRDGLHEVAKIQKKELPSKSNNEEKSVEDKRISKANGLQRKLAMTDLTLPAIKACRTPECACDLNK